MKIDIHFIEEKPVLRLSSQFDAHGAVVFEESAEALKNTGVMG